MRVRRVVESSGPVPWELKCELLEELSLDAENHRLVFRALHAALFDVCGSTNKHAAVRLLDNLNLADDQVPGLRSTRWAYTELPDGFANWADYQVNGQSRVWYRWGDDGELHEQRGAFPLRTPKHIRLLRRINSWIRQRYD